MKECEKIKLTISCELPHARVTANKYLHHTMSVFMKAYKYLNSCFTAVTWKRHIQFLN